MHSVLTPGQAGYELCLHDVCPYSRWSLRASVRAVFEVKVSVRRKNAPHRKNMAKAVAIRLVLCIPRSARMTYYCLVLSLHVFWKNIFTNSSTSCGLLRLMFQSWNKFTRGVLCFFPSQHHLQLNSVHDWNMGARHPSCWERRKEAPKCQTTNVNHIHIEFAARYHGLFSPMVSQTIVA